MGVRRRGNWKESPKVTGTEMQGGAGVLDTEDQVGGKGRTGS